MKILKDHGLNTENKTYVIAEIGINHGGDIDIAKKLIDSAALAGVDAVKFQTYLTEKRAPEGNKVIFDILKKCELPFEAFKELQSYTAQYNIDFFSTVFDEESLNYLESINCNLYKIPSFDVVNLKLLEKISRTSKPVIMSCGMSTLEEIKSAYGILRKGTDKVTLLHCVSAYPNKNEDANLASIYSLKENFDCVIGYSDHTDGILAPVYAVAAGAQVIENHYKIDDNMDCVDAPISISEAQMKEMIAEIRQVETMLGSEQLGIREPEKDIVVFRRTTQL